MGKAAGTMAVLAIVGSGAMTLFTSVLGAHAEAAALALMGLGLWGSGQLLALPQKWLGTKTSEAQ